MNTEKESPACRCNGTEGQRAHREGERNDNNTASVGDNKNFPSISDYLRELESEFSWRSWSYTQPWQFAEKKEEEMDDE
jgi:hypothetical protein